MSFTKKSITRAIAAIAGAQEVTSWSVKTASPNLSKGWACYDNASHETYGKFRTTVRTSCREMLAYLHSYQSLYFVKVSTKRTTR